MNGDTFRLFLGIEPDADTRNALALVRKELIDQNLRGRLYAPHLYHLTLCFLGNTPIERIAQLKEVMDRVPCTPFTLTLSDLGTFKNGSILWAGVERCDALHDYRARLACALQDAGFPLEESEYHPHITIGRQVKSEIPPLRVPQTAFKVDHSVLFQSTRIDDVLTYVPIYRSVFH